jgi:hypothetical protein
VDNDGDPLVAGALYFNDGTVTLDDKGMRVYDGGTWIAASAAQEAALVTYEFVATAGQTTFTGNDANGLPLTYIAGGVIVALNGVVLRPGDDFTATNGSSIVLTSAAALNDELVAYAFASFDVANTYTIAQADVLLAGKQAADAQLTTLAGASADRATFLASANDFTFRNRIINGDMRIDQRNAGASVTNTAGGVYTLDRYEIRGTQASKCTVQQSSTAATGFVNSALVTSSSAYSVLVGDYFMLSQLVEGTNIADFGWGTANAATVTLSFWVRSSLTGTFGGALRNSAADRSYPFTFTINAANTFEYKTVTIAGDTSGTWLTTTGIGIRISFGLGVGSTYSGTASAWAGANYLSATGAVSVVGTSGATFYITGVQLEAGSVATPFERRPFGTELALCQRYYEKSYNIDVAPGTVSDVGRVIARNVTVDTFGFPSVKVDFKVTKRATPTIVRYSTNDGASGNIYITSPAGNSTSNMVNDISMSGFNFYTVSNITNLGGLASMQWVSEIEL